LFRVILRTKRNVLYVPQEKSLLVIVYADNRLQNIATCSAESNIDDIDIVLKKNGIQSIRYCISRRPKTTKIKSYKIWPL